MSIEKGPRESQPNQEQEPKEEKVPTFQKSRFENYKPKDMTEEEKKEFEKKFKDPYQEGNG